MAVKRRKKRRVTKKVEKLEVDKKEEVVHVVNESPVIGDVAEVPQPSPQIEVPIVQEERKPDLESAPVQKKSKTHFTPSKMINLRGKDPNKVYYGVNKNMLGRVQRKIDEGMVPSTDQSLVNSSDNIAVGKGKTGSSVEIGDLIIMEASKEWGDSRKTYYKNKIRGKKDLQQDYMNKSEAGYGTIT